MFTSVNDDKLRQTAAAIKPRHTAPPRVSDWAGVIKFGIVAALMAGAILTTGSAEAAVAVGSSLGVLMRR